MTGSLMLLDTKASPNWLLPKFDDLKSPLTQHTTTIEKEVAVLNFLRPEEELKLLSWPKPPLDDLVIRLPLRTGLSPGEIADLQVPDVCWEYNVLFVWRSKVSRDHPVICDSDTMFRLWQYLDKRKSGPLLQLAGSRRMKVQAMRRIVKRWAREAGVPRWNRVTPYTLRHTFCCNWVLRRGSIEGLRRQTGHTNLQKLRDYLDFDYSLVELEYAWIFGLHREPELKPLQICYIM